MSDLADVLALHDVRPEDRRTHELLEEVLGRIGRIEATLSERTQDAPLSRVDRHLFAALVPEISAAVGDAAWTGRELLEHARARDPQLLTALDQGIGLDDGAARRFGRFLARVEGFTLDGHKVERICDGRDGVSWRIARVSLTRHREAE